MKHGLAVNTPKYSPSVKDHVIATIKEMRPYIFITDGVEQGSRFHSDAHIIWLMESNVSEAALQGNTHQWVLAALLEAGRSDYWYLHEKEWN